MSWEVEYTNQFGLWWERLSESQQDAVAVRVELLAGAGHRFCRTRAALRQQFTLWGLRHAPGQTGPLRVLYPDPRGMAILHVRPFDKTGNERFSEEFVPLADLLYDDHLAGSCAREGLIQ